MATAEGSQRRLRQRLSRA